MVPSKVVEIDKTFMHMKHRCSQLICMQEGKDHRLLNYQRCVSAQAHPDGSAATSVPAFSVELFDASIPSTVDLMC